MPVIHHVRHHRAHRPKYADKADRRRRLEHKPPDDHGQTYRPKLANKRYGFAIHAPPQPYDAPPITDEAFATRAVECLEVYLPVQSSASAGNVRPLDVLIDNAQPSAKYRLKLRFVSLVQLPNVRVHRIECESPKPLRPFVDKLMKRFTGATTWRWIAR